MHYPEDQLRTCMYKIITSLFPQKSLKDSCDSGGQANYKLLKRMSPIWFSSLEQFSKNIRLNIDITLRTC